MTDLTNYPAWVGLSVTAGLAGVIATHFGAPKPVAILAAVVLIAAAVAALAIDTERKRSPQSAPPPGPTAPAVPIAPVGLVGSRIGCAGGVFTVLDDSAVPGDGRRGSLVASDAHGTVGLLFIGFAADGTIAEARTDHTEWAPAALVG